MPLRVIGADLPEDSVQGSGSPFDIKGLNDTTGQNIQQGDAAQTAMHNTLAQQTEVVGKARAQIAQKEADNLAADGNQLFRLATVAGKAWERYYKIEENKAEKEKKQNEAWQDDQYAQTTQELQDAMFGMRQMIQQEGYSKGIVNARQRVTSVLAKSTHLTPEARRALAKEAYKQLDDLDYFFFKKSDEEMSDIKRQQTSTLEFDVRRQLATITARLKNGNESRESVQTLLDQTESVIAQATKQANLDPLQTASFHANMMKRVTEALEDNQGAKEQALARQSKATEWLNQVSSIANNNELSPEIKERLLAPVNEYYGYAWNKRPVSQMDVERDALERMQMRANLHEAAKKNYLTFEDAAKVDDGLVTEQALALFNDPSLEWKYKDDNSIDSQRVRERAKQFKEAIPRIREEQAKGLRLASEIAQAQSKLSVMESYVGMDIAALKKAGLPVPNTNDINELRAKIDGLEQQRQYQTSLIQNLAAPLQQAGLTFDNEGKVYMDAALQGKVEQARKTIKENGIRGNFKSGSTASPASKPLQKDKQGFFVPFSPGTDAPLTSGYGERAHPVYGGVKMHRGLDFGVPEGTPVASIKPGRVVRAGWLDGYGNTVEVEHPDGVTTLYAHLSQPLVRPGQQVGQGQVIARSGNTGTGTGAHLHFGAYKGAAESDSIDPMAYLRGTKKEDGGATQSYYSGNRGLGLPPNQAFQGSLQQPGGAVTERSMGGEAVEPTTVFTAEERMPQGALGLPTGGYIWEGRVYLPKSLYDANRAALQRTQRTVQTVSGGAYETEQSADSAPNTFGQAALAGALGNSVTQKKVPEYKKSGHPYIRFVKNELQLVDANGKVVDRVSAVSGRPNKQNFRGLADSESGSEEPVPEGVFDLGKAEEGDWGNPGLGRMWIDVTGTGKRKAIGIHLDADRSIKPGTEGCVAVGSEADEQKVLSWMRSKARPTKLVVDYDLGSVSGSYGKAPQPRYQDAGAIIGHFNKARPIPNALASNQLQDYNKRNDPKGNYGYSPIAQDASFARALAGTADRIGIPAQWLADVMAFETGGTFDPAKPNMGGSGAVGLIQFMPDTAASLGTSTGALASMTRTQQMRYVEQYFMLGIQEVGRFKRLDDVFAFIWGGGSLVRKSDAQRYGESDGDISYREYLRRLGEHAGRSYYTGLDRMDKSGRTHSGFKSGCPTCASMQQSLGKVVPHRAGR